MIIYLNLCSIKVHNLVIFRISLLKKKFSSFLVNFQFRAEVKKVTSQAELKNLQLELWLEPARLGLITSKHGIKFGLEDFQNFFYSVSFHEVT